MPRIFSYNFKSRGARKLSRALKWPRIVHRRSKFHGNFKPWILNWGSTEMELHVRECKMINTPEAIEETTDKVNFNMLMAGTGYIPDSTNDKEVVAKWLEKGKTVVARTLRRAHGGAGIVIVNQGDRIPNAPLYVLYVKKKDEYRVHIFGDKIIDIQKKLRRMEVPDDAVNWMVRNHDNGFIYSREELHVPDAVTVVAMQTFKKTDLDFGAVDIIYKPKKNRAYALEINTAPGLEGATLGIYVRAIRKFIG